MVIYYLLFLTPILDKKYPEIKLSFLLHDLAVYHYMSIFNLKNILCASQ